MSSSSHPPTPKSMADATSSSGHTSRRTSQERRTSHGKQNEVLGLPNMQSRASFRKSFSFDPIRRNSRMGGKADWDDMGHRKNIQALAPTYRMQPEQNEKFIAFVAKNIMSGILSSYLQNEKYNSTICSTVTKTLSELIKNRVMMECKLFSKRYKYVSMVVLGQKPPHCCPSIVCAARSLWDQNTDNFATATFVKGDLFAVATLFACYTE